MKSLPSTSLPITHILPEIYDHLNTQPNVIIVAPPGTGKTSLVPLSLLDSTWRQKRKIIMLEPRRVATRAAARQMSFLYQEEVGQTIGYRTRMEKSISHQTMIEVVTQGLFLRHLLNNPFLDDIAAIIFDEIHERSLDADLCLGLCRNLQQTLRPDLRLVAMSATPELHTIQPILDCSVIQSPNIIHPITIHHRQRDIMHLKELPTTMAATITQAWKEETGNILAFLPGAAEIHRTINLLSIPQSEILALYGDLPSREQDKALRQPTPQDKRRIILATSIAETSLTVPGVRIVIDGGYRRMPQLNADTGLTRLQTQSISRAAATQRAGRAGREGDGVVYQLWTKATERSMPLHDKPEILDAELSEFVLICQHWADIMGIHSNDIPFPDRPSLGVIEAAKELLILLGALKQNGDITPLGKKISQFGSHPRLASMMLYASTAQEKSLAADIAAILEERDPLRHDEHSYSDIKNRLNWLQHPPVSKQDQGIWHRIRKISQDYRKRLHIPNTVPPNIPQHTAHLICAAFPDRIAQRRSDIGSFRLAGGGAAHLSPQDPFAKENLLAIASIHVNKRSNICLAYPLHLNNLPPFIQERMITEYDTSLDNVSGKVIMRERLKFGRLTLQDKNIPATAEKALPILLNYIKNNIEKSLDWNERAIQLQARCAYARNILKKEHIADLSNDHLSKNCDEWISPWINGATNLDEIKQLDLVHVLKSILGYEQSQELNKELPEFVLLHQHKVFIDYTQTTPMVSAQARFFYGIKSTPTIANGKILLQCCLLSPANRPQAITSNLERFWNEGWKDMRRDMKGRYPKHNWPENPAILTNSQNDNNKK